MAALAMSAAAMTQNQRSGRINLGRRAGRKPLGAAAPFGRGGGAGAAGGGTGGGRTAADGAGAVGRGGTVGRGDATAAPLPRAGDAAADFASLFVREAGADTFSARTDVAVAFRAWAPEPAAADAGGDGGAGAALLRADKDAAGGGVSRVSTSPHSGQYSPAPEYQSKASPAAAFEQSARLLHRATPAALSVDDMATR